MGATDLEKNTATALTAAAALAAETAEKPVEVRIELY